MRINRNKARYQCFCRFLGVLSAIVLLLAFSRTVMAEELEMVNRPVNTSGLTGLLFTTTPFTLPQKSVEIGATTLSENSAVPNFSINELPAITVTMGITQGVELALKGSYVHKTMNGGVKERGAGDTELSYKWNFLPQTESASRPAVAIIISGIAPTSNKDLDLGGVTHWGARLGLSAGREMVWGDHVIGIYADAQMMLHDLSDERIRDSFGIVNTGLLIPISKYRNLQMIVEYNTIIGMSKITATGGDYSGVTYGLRLVSERFNLSIGSQFLRKEQIGFDNSTRLIGMTSFKF